jgi:FixJ family two-component response regulator
VARVWIVDSDHWPRAYLRAELIERGYDATGFSSLRDLLIELALARPRPALTVIDLQGQELNGRQLDAVLAAGAPVVAIGGAAEWGDDGLRARPWAAFLRRPITLGAVADEIDRLLGTPRGATRAR